MNIDSIIPNFDITHIDGISNVAEHWAKWLRSFKYFLTAKNVTNNEQKKALLLHLAGPEIQDLFETLPEGVGEEDQNAYEIAVSRLNTYFTPKRNLTYERHVFRTIKQSPGDSIDKFITNLRKQSSFCEFGTQVEQNIKDQLVSGCKDNLLRKKILEKGDDATLNDIIKLAHALELSEYQVKCFQGPSQTVNEIGNEEVNKIGKQQTERKHYKADKFKKEIIHPQKTKTNGKRCYRCDKLGHFANDESCPARKVKCRKCQKIGHFEKCCKTKHIHCIEKETTRDNFAFGINSVCDNIINCSVGNVKLDFLIDSGSSVNVVDKQTWDYLKSKNVKCTSWKVEDERIFPYGVSEGIKILGKFQTEITCGNESITSTFSVIDGVGRPILSSNSAKELQLIKVNVNSIENTHETLFKGVGKLKDYKLKLHIDNSVKPVIQKVRTLPHSVKEKVEKEIDRLISQDIIERVEEPSQWVSPIVPVPKKGGEEVRICIDMREANEAILRVRHPMPTIEDILLTVGQGKWFSKLDLKWGFHQIELEEESREITTFITHTGLYRFKRLLFGVNSAPEMYQHILAQIVSDLDGVVNFVDDLIVYASSEEEHDNRLQKLLSRLKDKGLTLNKDKCDFKKQSIEILGFEVGSKGISLPEQKVKAIVEARQPRNVSEVKSFLGLANFCRKYMCNLSSISAPLRNLLKEGVKFKWTKNENDAFIEIKNSLKNNVLAPFSYGEETILVADASPVGLGAILLQRINGEERVISYASRGLTEVECRYSQTEKEALAIVWSMEHFYAYLYGIEFELRTDHKPLIYIYTTRSKPSARIERWVLRLQHFKFKIKHIPGELNIADTLSRLSVNQKKELVHDAEEYVYFLARQSTPNALSTREIEQESYLDMELRAVREAILSGNFDDLKLQAFKLIRNELTILGYLVLRGSRIVIPTALRKRVLSLGHEGHQGIVKTKARMRSKVWWPGMDKEIEKNCQSCKSCILVSQTNAPDPIKPTQMPKSSWEFVAADILGPIEGDYILVVVDYYSRWFEVRVLQNISSMDIIKAFNSIWATHGLPMLVKTDNGRQFISEQTTTYFQEMGIQQVNSTPLNPSENGEVERQNRTILKTIKIAKAQNLDWHEELDKFLLIFRTTPHSSTGFTPSNLMFNREMRTKLPEMRTVEKENVFKEEIRDRDNIYKEKMKEYVDRSRKAVENDLKVGDEVLVKNDKKGKLDTNFKEEKFVVAAKAGSQITVKNGEKEYKRNSTFLKKIPAEETENLYQPGANNNDFNHKNDSMDSSKTKSGRSIKPVLRFGFSNDID